MSMLPAVSTRRLSLFAVAAALLCAPCVRAQEGLGGLAAGSAMAATMGGIGAGVAGRGATQGLPGQLTMPGMDDGTGGAMSGPMMPGAGLPGMMGGTGRAVAVPQQPDAWGSASGDTFLAELRAGSRASTRTSRVSRAQQRRRARVEAARARRFARLTPSQRRRVLAARYRKPPVGYLAYYAPEDRYKLTSNVWRYVSIEDDSRAYPVRYYYAPSSSRMLRLLAARVKGQPRRNRVIGFHTWQEAMQAGYRPDPVSRPAPANDIAYLARLTRSRKLSRYVSFVYAGQVDPATFSQTIRYVRQVQRVVASRSDTRPMMGGVIGDVLAAALGEGRVPTQIGGDPVPRQANAGMGGMMPGMGMGMTPNMPSPMMPAPMMPQMGAAPGYPTMGR